MNEDQNNLNSGEDKDAASFQLSSILTNKTLIIFFLIILFMIVGGGGFLLVYYLKNKPTESARPVIYDRQFDNGAKVQDYTGGGMLPADFENNNGSNNGLGGLLVDIKAENLTFGMFYKKSAEKMPGDADTYELPQNAKQEISNYYDIARKIDVDTYIDDINENGFAIAVNPYAKSNDFFSSFQALTSKNIPVVVSEDFLIYYYQNYLKDIYKDIESDLFYENIWDINKKLYDIANTRYKKTLAETGLINDPILEAQRLETAYFAVALKLLEFEENQINADNNFADPYRVSRQEADDYIITLPEYLTTDVNQELSLIQKAQGSQKSPVLRYSRDYTGFKVPSEYNKKVKLYNFYLAMRWMNTLFPLNYTSESCENCLLDQEDWLINFTAAHYIAKDFADNQDLKNQWAMIYKVISYFSGLRKDLTYLHYRAAYNELFGERDIAEVFSELNPNQNQNATELKNRIEKYNFLEIEGGLNRDDEYNSPSVGLKILQDYYWPDNYLFAQLTTPNVSNHKGNYKELLKNSQAITACFARLEAYRCRGFGLDIINLISPLSEKSSDFFFYNTYYENYNSKFNSLTAQLDKFNVDSWHNNDFWTTLNTSKQILKNDNGYMPAYAQTNQWTDKSFNTVLGAWVNMQLPPDKLGLQGGGGVVDAGLGTFRAANSLNYIEPNWNLIQELIANTEMLHEMLIALGVTEKINSVSLDLIDLKDDLGKIKDIIGKELVNGSLNEEEVVFIDEFVKRYKVDQSATKQLRLKFGNGKYAMSESVSGIKLLYLVYERDGKKIISIGPVFNYKESAQ